MGLRRTPSFVVLTLLSCGGRSGLGELAGSELGGARADGGAAMTLAAAGHGGAHAGQSQAGAVGTLGGGGGSSAAAGSNSLGGADAGGGGAAIGAWTTLHHTEPPPPHDNPFDWVGIPSAFTDVWSDDPGRALIATATTNYKAPPTGGVVRFERGELLGFDIGEGLRYQPPRFAGLSMSDLWLAEDYFGLRHSDGAAWTIYAEPAAQLIWESAPNDLWVCAPRTAPSPVTTYQLLHLVGGVWSLFALPTADNFVPHGLWSRSPTDTFVAGSTGTLLHWNGTNFEVRQCPGVDVWNAVWGDAAAVWTVGTGGAVARWQGEKCTLLSTESLLGGVRVLSDIWGSGPDNVWIVGQQGSILRWNGRALELEPSGLSVDLNAVWGHASGVVWAVGNNETLLRRAF